MASQVTLPSIERAAEGRGEFEPAAYLEAEEEEEDRDNSSSSSSTAAQGT